MIGACRCVAPEIGAGGSWGLDERGWVGMDRWSGRGWAHEAEGAAGLAI